MLKTAILAVEINYEGITTFTEKYPITVFLTSTSSKAFNHTVIVLRYNFKQITGDPIPVS